MKILVVEDHNHYLQRIKNALKDHDVDGCQGAYTAFEKLSTNKYDLVVLDFVLAQFDADYSDIKPLEQEARMRLVNGTFPDPWNGKDIDEIYDDAGMQRYTGETIACHIRNGIIGSTNTDVPIICISSSTPNPMSEYTTLTTAEISNAAKSPQAILDVMARIFS